MITVAGFNTAIDRRLDLHTLQPGIVQRALAATASAGGKGLHVAQTIAALGEPVQLIGLTDAAHASMLAEYLEARGVRWRPVESPNGLRQCLALHEDDGRVTEILEPGPELDVGMRQALLDAVHASLGASPILILSGSLPRGFAPDTYASLIREAGHCGVRCLLDTSGDALRHAVDAAPWLVKPNADEAAALGGQGVDTIDDAVTFVRWLHAQGIARAVVTLGARGAVGFDGVNAWHAAPDGGEASRCGSAVGSGDCFFAGLAVAAVRDLRMDESLRLATACGAANLLHEETGCVRRDQVERLLQYIQVHRLT